MINNQLLRQNLDVIAKKLATRGYNLDKSKFKKFETQRKEYQIKTQKLQYLRNSLSKEIGIYKKQRKNFDFIMKQLLEIKEQLKLYELNQNKIQSNMQDLLLEIPNVPNESTPIGQDELKNIEIRKWGKKPTFDFIPKEHFELTYCYENGSMDFKASSRMSGSRFVVLSNQIAKLQRVLIQFMLDTHTREHGYIEKYVPILVKSNALYGTGQFPKFIKDLYGTINDDMWLIPTSEVSLINLVRDQIIDHHILPIKYVAHTPCFRKESGTYGKDTKGMFRQHQFEKVELIQIVNPDDSYQALENITQHAEKILQLLKLPYRVLDLCTGDLSFASAKTYDIEVWLPGQNAYREISSCSNAESFQSRRMQIRWRNPKTNKIQLLHTLNGSGLAVGRTLIAILENYQQKNNIKIPDILRGYFNGARVLIE